LSPNTAILDPEQRRRITQLMVVRLVLVTLVLGTTVGLHLAAPEDLALPSAISVFTIVATTYVLSLVYALWMRRGMTARWFLDMQMVGDLVVTTSLVHVTGGAQSGYVFFYPLSIIGAVLLRYRRGAMMVAAACVVLYASVSVAGWLRWLPVPAGLRLAPWELSGWSLLRHVVLNSGAFAAIASLAAYLGQQLAQTGERLEDQRNQTADLAVLNEDIIRCLSSGLVTVDQRGTILTCNQAALEILGRGDDTVVGQSIAVLMPQMDALLGELGSRGAIRRAEVHAVRAGGRASTLGVSITPLTDHLDLPVGRIVNFQDLTELRRMEGQIQRAERLAVVGQLAAGVAHEIRNPLASISGSIELLKNAPQVDDDNRALMDIVLREVERLNGLVTELLDYATPRAPVPLAFELSGLLEETCRVFAQDRSFHDVHVTLQIADDARNVPICADSSQIRQVVWNLLRNAAEAMPSGGEVMTQLERSSDGMALRVTDTGTGIRPEDQERIFDPFFTTKSRGSGLGLPTVHRIVSEHGGTISVSSQLTHGTQILVKLPLATDKLRPDTPRGKS
jgi:two-component system sensor histidine kinase PilS (NtrC family)